MRKRICLLLFAAALLMPLASCVLGRHGGETSTPAAQTSGAEAPPDPLGDILQEKAVHSTQLYSGDGYMIFVSPRENELVRVDTETGRSLALCGMPVYREFLVIEERIFFRDLDSGRICAVNTDGENLISYYSMPFCHGVMKNGVMYFLNTEDNFSNEAVLYIYDPLKGIWSTNLLSGCRLSPVRRTAVFGDDSLYYISGDAGAERVVCQALETGERTVVYTAEAAREGCLTELSFRGGALYFHDAAADAAFRYAASAGGVQRLEIDGDRICEVLPEGILFSSSEAGGSKLFFGNASGQTAEYQGGVVMAAGGSRALLRRTGEDGSDVLAVVKYPEDEVQEQMSGMMNRVVTDNSGNAVVFFYGSHTCYHVDLNSGRVCEYSVRPLYLDRLPIPRYLSEGTAESTVLSGFDRTEVTPQQFTRALATAVAGGDRLSIARLLTGMAELSAFPPIEMKSWTVSRDEAESGDNRVVYRIEYTPYAAADLLCLRSAPAIIRECKLTFELNEGAWRLVQP